MNFYDVKNDIETDTEFVIFGIPWDYLTSIDTPNSAIAPEKIREVSHNLALTTELGQVIPELKVRDLGDVNIEARNVEKNLEAIRKFVLNIFERKNKIIPVMIGGDHFCSFPVIKAVGDNFKKKNEFGILVFDAHLDLYDNWDKGRYSHATITRRLYDLDYINNKNLLIVGTRDIDILELQYAKEEQITFYNAHEYYNDGVGVFTDKIINYFKNSNIKNLYISIDIDVLDPSAAPGTGYAIPGGLSYRDMRRILYDVAKGFNIIAFDLVEVAPNLDLSSNITSNLAAKLIIELISFISIKE